MRSLEKTNINTVGTRKSEQKCYDNLKIIEEHA